MHEKIINPNKKIVISKLIVSINIGSDNSLLSKAANVNLFL